MCANIHHRQIRFRAIHFMKIPWSLSKTKSKFQNTRKIFRCILLGSLSFWTTVFISINEIIAQREFDARMYGSSFAIEFRHVVNTICFFHTIFDHTFNSLVGSCGIFFCKRFEKMSVVSMHMINLLVQQKNKLWNFFSVWAMWNAIRC